MNLLSGIKKIILFLIFIQFGIFIFVKQRYSELERRNQKLESEISNITNENNLLKIKLTTVQNSYRIKTLTTKYASNFRAFKPNQVIEKESI